MKFIKKIPMAISGLSLALAAIGNLLLPYGEGIRHLCGIGSAAILCLYVLKLMLDSEQVKEELKNPVALSIMPTSTMALMILCVYSKPYIGPVSVCLWYAAVIAHALIIVLFTKKCVLDFKLQAVFPSWLVTFVGFVTASATSPAMDARLIGQIIFYFGFITYFLITPVILYRMATTRPLPEPTRPTIAILNAPMTLCLVGYIAAFDHPNDVMICIMLLLAVITYIYVSVEMIMMLRIKFYPTYAAMAFPYVISAVAFNAANVFLVNKGYDFFVFVPKITELIAVIVVVYVLARYSVFLFSTFRA